MMIAAFVNVYKPI